MMNLKRSSKLNIVRYAAILPLVGLLSVFTISKAVNIKHVAKLEPADKPAAAPVSIQERPLTVSPLPAKQTDQPAAQSQPGDTMKTVRASLGTTGFSDKDSLNYAIDGMPAALSMVMALDNSDIESIAVISPAFSNRLGLTGKKQAIVIFTKNNDNNSVFSKMFEKIKAEAYTIGIMELKLTNGDNVADFNVPGNINVLADKPLEAKMLDGTIVKIIK